MQKLQYWAVGILVSVTSLTLSSAAIALPRQSDYFCFKQQITGRVQNLTAICQSSQPRTNATDQKAGTPTPGSKPNEGKKLVAVESGAKRVLEFSELNYEDGVLVGYARNKTGKPIGRVSINYGVYERESETKWKLVDSGSTRTEANSLKSGEKTTFKATPRIKGDKIVIMKAEF